MNEAQITVTGWVAADPYYAITGNGTPFLSLRVGCTPRRYDRQSAQWQDLDTLFLTVNCWRNLADNINASEFRRGHPVVVTGRLRIRQYEKDGQWRFSAEIEAGTLSHDLNRGTADFRPVQRGGGIAEADRREAHAATDQWALTPKTAADPAPTTTLTKPTPPSRWSGTPTTASTTPHHPNFPSTHHHPQPGTPHPNPRQAATPDHQLGTPHPDPRQNPMSDLPPSDPPPTPHDATADATNAPGPTGVQGVLDPPEEERKPRARKPKAA